MKTSYPKLHSIKYKNGILADNVVKIQPYVLTADLNPDAVLMGAIESRVQDVIIIGHTKAGLYVSSNMIDDHRVIGKTFEGLIYLISERLK